MASAKALSEKKVVQAFSAILDETDLISAVDAAIGELNSTFQLLVITPSQDREIQAAALNEVMRALHGTFQRLAGSVMQIVARRIPRLQPISVRDRERFLGIFDELLDGVFLCFEDSTTIAKRLAHYTEPLKKVFEMQLSTEQEGQIGQLLASASVKHSPDENDARAEQLSSIMHSVDKSKAAKLANVEMSRRCTVPITVWMELATTFLPILDGAPPPGLDQLLKNPDMTGDMRASVRSLFTDSCRRLKQLNRIALSNALDKAKSDFDATDRNDHGPRLRSGEYRLIMSGSEWFLAFGRNGTARIPNSLGIQYLSLIIEAAGDGQGAIDVEKLYLKKHPAAAAEQVDPSFQGGPAVEGRQFSRETRRGYEADLHRLLKDFEAAKQRGDSNSVEQLEPQVAALRRELGKLPMDRGTTSSSGSRDERGKRVYSVQKAVRGAIAKLASDNQPAARALSHHFSEQARFRFDQRQAIYSPGRIRWKQA